MRYPQGDRAIDVTPEHIERFWANVDTTGECWEWTGRRFPTGYGSHYLGQSITAYPHRFSWLLHGGQLPEGMLVCHKCDNPPCCNPDHLFLGTPLDNARDRTNKGRRGGRPPGSRYGGRLTERDVREIKVMLAAGVNQYRIAAAYGVTQGAISHISTGRIFRHTAQAEEAA